MVIDGGALGVIEQDQPLLFMTIEHSKNCEIRRHSVPIKGEPWLTSVELCPAKNVQAGHGWLWDITSVGCAEPNT